MKVLILGGTKFFGKEVARQFQAAGHSVTLFTRGNLVAPDLPPCSFIKGDRKNPADLKRAAGFPWDVVIDNLAYSGEDVRLVLDALGPIPHYILTSTVSVYRYAERPEQPLLEKNVNYDRKPAAENLADIHWSYAHGKWEAEKVLRAQSRVPWTIFRPTVIYGPGDPLERGWWYLARLRRGGPILLANGGAASFRLVYSYDVAAAYLTAATNRIARGKVYNLAQSEVITLRDFVEQSAAALGVPCEGLGLPREILGNLAGPHGDLVNLIPDIGEAVRELAYSPTPWPVFCSASTRWFIDQWRGDEAELLKTRAEELKLANQWRAFVATLR